MILLLLPSETRTYRVDRIVASLHTDENVWIILPHVQNSSSRISPQFVVST